jgi:hypothetical protein
MFQELTPKEHERLYELVGALKSSIERAPNAGGGA